MISSPVLNKRASNVDDATVLNFALTLEHLENAFYSGALAKYNAKAFTDAGLPSFARARFTEVAAHEKAHVAFLSNALGANATAPCNYSFPYTDPKSFAALSQVLEGVGVSAYAGAAQLITNKDYLTAAAIVLSTEARHASWVAAAVNKYAGWSGPFDTPLGLNEVYTLAAQFITSCPSTNPTLPVKAFPTITVKPAAPKPGSSITVSYANMTSSQLYAYFYTGLSTEKVKVKNGKVTIPSDLVGQIYMVLSTNGTAVSESSTVAGPAVLQFETNSAGVVVT